MKIGTRRLSYILNDYTSYSKINILQGESATGKTKFFDICLSLEKGVAGFSSTSEYKIHSLISITAEECNSEVLTRRDQLILIDEDSPFLQQDSGVIQDVIYKSNNKFMIISRDKKLNFLSVGVNDIYHIKNHGKYNTIDKRFVDNIYYLKSDTSFDLIITEDSKSSFLFFNNYFPDIPVRTSKGKDNLIKCVSEILRGDYLSILISIDNCAFGLRFEGLIEMLENSEMKCRIIPWLSFEEYILRSENFYKLDISHLCRESDFENYLKQLIYYNKESLTHCLNKNETCSNCKHLSECKYPVFNAREDNYIHDELKLISLVKGW